MPKKLTYSNYCKPVAKQQPKMYELDFVRVHTFTVEGTKYYVGYFKTSNGTVKKLEIPKNIRYSFYVGNRVLLSVKLESNFTDIKATVTFLKNKDNA